MLLISQRGDGFWLRIGEGMLSVPLVRVDLSVLYSLLFCSRLCLLSEAVLYLHFVRLLIHTIKSVLDWSCPGAVLVERSYAHCQVR